MDKLTMETKDVAHIMKNEQMPIENARERLKVNIYLVQLKTTSSSTNSTT
ncbi:MAG: hypothetical protein ACT6FC_04075 [Methanosarcinaceae archaeon]